MFSKLTDFSYKRTGLQAFGFYLTYLIMVMLAGAVAGIIGALAAGEDTGTFSNGVRLGTLIAIVASISLSFQILRAKKINSFSLRFLAILAGVLALLGGSLLGMIIPAVFTTKGTRTKNTRKKN